ncbi:MAG: hypothetical protein ACEQSA_05285 [Weeksellaceae bacterium]
MKQWIGVVLIPFFLALIVYWIFTLVRDSNKSLSPIPEDGINVIQLTPSK